MRQSSEKEHLLELTLAVYKVTAIFPIGKEGDNLSSKIRQLADKILAKLSLDKVEDIIKLFDQAEKKNWVDPRNFLVLRREYESIQQLCALPRSAQFTVHSAGVHSDGDRHGKILAVMASNNMVKIGDILRLLPGVNRRTILRDLDKLCQTGAMIRNGNGRGVYYAKNGQKCDMSQ